MVKHRITCSPPSPTTSASGALITHPETLFTFSPRRHWQDLVLPLAQSILIGDYSNDIRTPWSHDKIGQARRFLWLTKCYSSETIIQLRFCLLWCTLYSSRSCQIGPHAYHCHLTREFIFDKYWVPSHDDSHKQEATVSCRGGIECVVYTCSMFSSTYFPPLSHALYYVNPSPHSYSYHRTWRADRV